MGKLAQSAILGGKRVPLEQLPAVQDEHIGSAFLWKAFERSGIRDIAEKIFYCQPLLEDDITRLLEGTSLPVLMKLVELQGEHEVIEPVPVLCVPFARWCQESTLQAAIARLSTIPQMVPYTDCRVVFDSFEYHLWNVDFFEQMVTLKQEHSSLSFVGPSIEEVLGWLKSRGVESTSLLTLKLRAILHKLRGVGFSRLKATASSASVRVLIDAGFPVSLRTPIDIFPTNRELARELYRINSLSGVNQHIQLWVPEIRGDQGLQKRSPLGDIALLRALAVASVALPQVPFRRASSRELSVEAFAFSRLCGANEFGVGAVDEMTAHTLEFQFYKDLLKTPRAQEVTS